MRIRVVARVEDSSVNEEKGVELEKRGEELAH